MITLKNQEGIGQINNGYNMHMSWYILLGFLRKIGNIGEIKLRSCHD